MNETHFNKHAMLFICVQLSLVFFKHAKGNKMGSDIVQIWECKLSPALYSTQKKPHVKHNLCKTYLNTSAIQNILTCKRQTNLDLITRQVWK